MTRENMGGGELLTSNNGGDGVGIKFVREKEGKWGLWVRNLARETVGSIFARERERRGQIGKIWPAG